MQELQNALAALGKKADEVAGDALKAGGEVIARDASSRAPRSRLSKPHLADHIVVGDPKVERGIHTVEVGLEGGSERGRFYYGRYLETGTKKMRARPFLGPAAEAKADDAARAMAEALKKGLDL